MKQATHPGSNTTVLMLLSSSPIANTLQLQQRVAVQPAGSYLTIHNLIIFFWGDAPSVLESPPLSASYFPATSDKEIIQSLSLREGRVFADDQPLPKFGQPDPDFKGNKWIDTSGKIPPK